MIHILKSHPALRLQFHDVDLGRMCGPTYDGMRIEDLTFAELPHVFHKPPVVEEGHTGGVSLGKLSCVCGGALAAACRLPNCVVPSSACSCRLPNRVVPSSACWLAHFRKCWARIGGGMGSGLVLLLLQYSTQLET